MAVSKSNEHAWSPGTLWLSATTMLAVLDELAPVAWPPPRCASWPSSTGMAGTARLLAGRRAGHPGSRNGAAGVRHAPVGAAGTTAGPRRPASWAWASTRGSRRPRSCCNLRPDLVRLSLGVRSVPEHLASFSRVGFRQAGVVSRGCRLISAPTGRSAIRRGRRPSTAKEKYEAMIVTAAAVAGGDQPVRSRARRGSGGTG